MLAVAHTTGRWDDDVVFKNQARGIEGKKKKEFVNVYLLHLSSIQIGLISHLGLATVGFSQALHGTLSLAIDSSSCRVQLKLILPTEQVRPMTLAFVLVESSSFAEISSQCIVDQRHVYWRSRAGLYCPYLLSKE